MNDMDAQIAALIAQSNAAMYFKRAQQLATYGLWASDIRIAVVECQQRSAHHAAIARAAIGIED